MILAKLLTAYRAKRQLSLRALAEEIGVREIQVFRFETGRNINHIDLCIIIAWVLSTPIKKRIKGLTEINTKKEEVL